VFGHSAISPFLGGVSVLCSLFLKKSFVFLLNRYWGIVTVVASVLSRVFAAILCQSEHCVVAFFAQGAKNYTDVKLVLLYRLIFGT